MPRKKKLSSEIHFKSRIERERAEANRELLELIKIGARRPWTQAETGRHAMLLHHLNLLEAHMRAHGGLVVSASDKAWLAARGIKLS